MPIFAGKVTNRVYSARELASRVVDQTLFQGMITILPPTPFTLILVRECWSLYERNYSQVDIVEP